MSFNFGSNLNDKKYTSSQAKGIIWDGLVWKGDLFLTIPDGFGNEPSKEAFISLLEYAEEQLHCNCVIVCFSKMRPDRAATMRMFMFFGFELLSPNDPKAPSESTQDDTLYMAYQIC